MMRAKKIRIAYLAPEIPALSATFVYNEILELEKRGFEIVPLSVHVPASPAAGEALKRLALKTRYLYARPNRDVVLANLRMFFKNPLRYASTLATAISDAVRVGIFRRLAAGLLYRFWVASCTAAILIEEECRHLHVHFAHIPTDIAMYASRISGVPFSFTAHANDLFERGWLLSQKVRRAAFAVTISRYNRRFIAGQGAPAAKIFVVRCGVDAGAFQTRAEKPRANVPSIGTLGRMVEKKGFDTLIRAAGNLRSDRVPFHLSIAGDGPLRQDLGKLVDTLDLSRDVSFPGALPHHRVSEWLKKLDVFVLPCRKDAHNDMDGIPVVLMEAMLSGIPVVSTRISGIPELVVDGKTGLLADPDDPQSLARAVRRILSDDRLRSNLCRNAVFKVRAEFDLSRNVQLLSNLFKGAIS